MPKQEGKTSTPKVGERDANALLDLTKISAPADYVRLDGETYDLVNIDAFSLQRRAQFNVLTNRVDALRALTEPNQDDSREFESKMRELAAIALPTAPAAVLAKLDLGQLDDLIFAFFLWAAERSPKSRLLRRIGAMSSQGSNGSTAATR